MKIPVIIIFSFVLLLQSCEQKNDNGRKSGFSNQLKQIDYSDSIFRYHTPNDTVLSSGWAINYLIKDDTTRYKDIYIKVLKNKDSAIYFGQDLLMFRTYFIPVFSAENDHFIFFDHGCATSCGAVLVFDKQTLKFKDFDHIIDYSVKTNEVVWLPDQSLRDDKPFSVQVTSLLKQKDTIVTFNNLALSSVKESYVDTVIFETGKTIINCTLVDKSDFYRAKEVKESRIVKFQDRTIGKLTGKKMPFQYSK